VEIAGEFGHRLIEVGFLMTGKHMVSIWHVMQVRQSVMALVRVGAIGDSVRMGGRDVLHVAILVAHKRELFALNDLAMSAL
jgi:hypothetical protein